MDERTAMTVGSVARLSGLTVRTLHHYDDVGLVVPGRRTAAGYRLYGPSDIARLQEVLCFRELGFGLDEIKEIVERPTYDRVAALERQRRLIEAKADHLLSIMEAIEGAIEAERRGTTMTNEEMLEVFGGFDPAEFEEEAQERWGGTDAYSESARRTARYTTEDWEHLGREARDINGAFVDLMRAGEPADGEPAMALAERHRAHISRWFYDCSPEIHAGLGQMYVADHRLTENIDKAAPGLAHYLSRAIAANAEKPAP